MTEQDIKTRLLAEIENKKRYPAYSNTYCGECQYQIPEGQPAVYIGDKIICNDCEGEIIEFLGGEQ